MKSKLKVFQIFFQHYGRLKASTLFDETTALDEVKVSPEEVVILTNRNVPQKKINQINNNNKKIK